MTADALRHYPPVESRVKCAGHTHRLHWQAGELSALDHADAQGERTLAALGGQRYTCIDALEIWARHADDLQTLILTSRGPTDQVAWPKPSPQPGAPFGAGTIAGLADRQTGSMALHFPGAGAAPPPSAKDQLVALLALDGRLADRLALTVAATWAERLTARDPRARPAQAKLIAALHGRVTCTLRSWLAEPHLDVDVEMIDHNAPPTITRSGHHILASLPFDWIVNVWGRNPIVSDRLALAVLDATADHLSLITIDHTLANPRPVTLSLG